MLYFLPAIVLLIIGWLIKYQKITWLISGYNTASPQEKERYDIDKLSKYMGNYLFILASVFSVMAITTIYYDSYSDRITWIGFLVLIFALVIGIVYLNTGNRVLKE
jgi:hypothetical protein